MKTVAKDILWNRDGPTAVFVRFMMIHLVSRTSVALISSSFSGGGHRFDDPAERLVTI